MNSYYHCMSLPLLYYHYHCQQLHYHSGCYMQYQNESTQLQGKIFDKYKLTVGYLLLLLLLFIYFSPDMKLFHGYPAASLMFLSYCGLEPSPFSFISKGNNGILCCFPYLIFPSFVFLLHDRTEKLKIYHCPRTVIDL